MATLFSDPFDALLQFQQALELVPHKRVAEHRSKCRWGLPADQHLPKGR